MKSVAALAGSAAMAVTLAPAAHADDLTPTDSHGISILDYPLSFNEGGGKAFGLVVTPTVTATASFAVVAFGFFIGLAWLVFSCFKLFVRLDWIPPLVDVAQRISDSLTTQMGREFTWSIVAGTMLLTVVIFALRHRGGRAWHHIAVTMVCLGVGVIITVPVGEAAHLLKIGRDAATTTAAAVTPQGSTDATALLIDRFVRQPNQRWQFGQDLDSLGCGQAWDSAVAAIKTGAMDVAKIKDVPLSCPGGSVGEQMHAFAMNPTGAVWLGFLNPVFMMLVAALVGMVMLMIAATAVSAIIHAALIKPGLILAGTPFGQSFLARNAIDGYTAALQTCGLLLLLIVGGSMSGLVAAAVPSSQLGMLLTLIIMVAMIVGARRAGRNLRRLKAGAARAVLPAGAPGAYGPPSTAPAHARRMATQTARQVAAQRRNRALRRTVVRAGERTVAAEMMIPAQAAGVLVQHVLYAAAQHQQATAGLYGNGDAGGAGRRDRRTTSPGTRSTNYGHTAASTGAGSARGMARRARERRYTVAAANAAAAAAPGPGRARSRTPAAAAVLRSAAGGVAAMGRPGPPGRTLVEAVPAFGGAGVRASGGAAGRAAAPLPSRGGGGGGGVPQRPRGAGAAAPAAAVSPVRRVRQGAAQGMRRSGVIGSARDAARNFRSRR